MSGLVLPEALRGAAVGSSFDGWPLLEVDPGRWREACRWAKEDEGLNFLAHLTAVHYLDDGYLLLVAYTYRVDGTTPVSSRRLSLATRLEDRIGVEVDSVACVWPTAEWHEREVWDLFGIRFRGNPDLRRILLDEGFDGHPLRKDFVDRKPNLGVSKETLQKDAASKR